MKLTVIDRNSDRIISTFFLTLYNSKFNLVDNMTADEVLFILKNMLFDVYEITSAAAIIDYLKVLSESDHLSIENEHRFDIKMWN